MSETAKAYEFKLLYESKAKQLAGMITNGHYPSIDKMARLLAQEDWNRKDKQ